MCVKKTLLYLGPSTLKIVWVPWINKQTNKQKDETHLGQSYMNTAAAVIKMVSKEGKGQCKQQLGANG